MGSNNYKASYSNTNFIDQQNSDSIVNTDLEQKNDHIQVKNNMYYNYDRQKE